MPGGGHLPRGRGPRGDGELHSQKRRLLRVTTPVSFQPGKREKLRPLALLSGPRTSEKSMNANFVELRKVEIQLPRMPKRRSSKNSYSTHWCENPVECHPSTQVEVALRALPCDQVAPIDGPDAFCRLPLNTAG